MRMADGQKSFLPCGYILTLKKIRIWVPSKQEEKKSTYFFSYNISWINSDSELLSLKAHCGLDWRSHKLKRLFFSAWCWPSQKPSMQQGLGRKRFREVNNGDQDLHSCLSDYKPQSLSIKAQSILKWAKWVIERLSTPQHTGFLQFQLDKSVWAYLFGFCYRC